MVPRHVAEIDGDALQGKELVPKRHVHVRDMGPWVHPTDPKKNGAPCAEKVADLLQRCLLLRRDAAQIIDQRDVVLLPLVLDLLTYLLLCQ